MLAAAWVVPPYFPRTTKLAPGKTRRAWTISHDGMASAQFCCLPASLELIIKSGRIQHSPPSSLTHRHRHTQQRHDLEMEEDRKQPMAEDSSSSSSSGLPPPPPPASASAFASSAASSMGTCTIGMKWVGGCTLCLCARCKRGRLVATAGASAACGHLFPSFHHLSHASPPSHPPLLPPLFKHRHGRQRPPQRGSRGRGPSAVSRAVRAGGQMARGGDRPGGLAGRVRREGGREGRSGVLNCMNVKPRVVVG